MNSKCPVLGPKCDLCDCTGRRCSEMFPGLKVEWPELRGVSGVEAKMIIERENPKVVAFIYPEGLFYLPEVMCCNRVLLYVPADNCPNGPVINSPFVG
ncbi:PREDICTED: inhibitor of trypsin and hageman factor [Tarenaya hassleriana]|uniref:inhibitor of trypsin and hageman factor n=1 Tax=Tarenaya hassleriana TaxID=28532 RepID=UPI0008FCF5DB|nr:PREDICTED: inhibitor of trypsin and hageman factor [Tarenaya hassleriana]